MQSFDEKSWNEFYLNDIFGFKLAKGDNQPKNMNQGRIPVVSAGETNNGVTAFVSNPDEGSVFQSGTVTVDMFGKAFWHGYDYCAVSHGRVNILDLNVPNNSSQFISTCIDEGTISKYSYNQMCSQKRLTRQKVMLPVTDSGEPDYEYMAEYTRQKRDAMLNEYRKYVEARIEELGELVEIPVLGKKEWKPFSIVELFPKIIPGRGKGLNHLPKVNTGGVNYIGATNRNNGVLCYVEEDDYSRPMILDGNCIGFIKNGDGSAGFAIYKAEKFISTSDVLYGYADWLNRFTGIFFVTAQDMIEHKYSHGYKRNKEHLAGDKVMLPIDNSGEPDYAYMEQYAKNMMLRKYQQYLEFINRQNVAEVE